MRGQTRTGEGGAKRFPFFCNAPCVSSSVEGIVTDHTQRLTNLDASVTGLQSSVGALGSRVDTLETKTRRNTSGIAASMVIPNLTIPAGKSFAFGMDLSTHDGMQGVGASVAGAINKTWSVLGSVTGSLQGGAVGVKGGVRAAF